MRQDKATATARMCPSPRYGLPAGTGERMFVQTHLDCWFSHASAMTKWSEWCVSALWLRVGKVV